MSNLFTSPDSRPLEVLKVAELKDELRKRGLSIKGVKKELLERLEEAVQTEEQEGTEHGASQGVEKTGTNEATEDEEEGVGVLDEPNGSHSHDVSDVDRSGKTVSSYPNDSLPSSHSTEMVPMAPLPMPSSEATLICQTHVSSSDVSAPDGVPGLIEGSEQFSAPGGESEGIHNDVMLVDNAACENGDAVLLAGNVSGVADMPDGALESGCTLIVDKVIASKGMDVSMENGALESGCTLIVDKVIASKEMDVSTENGALESGCTLSVDKGIASKEIDMSMENGGGCASAEDAVFPNEARIHRQDLQMSSLPAVSEVVALQVSMSEAMNEVASEGNSSLLETEHKAMSEPKLDLHLPVAGAMDNSPEKDVDDGRTMGEASEGMKPPIGDDGNMLVTDEKPIASMEMVDTMPEEKLGVVNAGAMEQSDAKMEPMHADAGLEDRHQVSNEGLKGMQIDEGVSSQLASLVNQSSLNGESKVEKSSSGEEIDENLAGNSINMANGNPVLNGVKDESEDPAYLKRKGADSKEEEEPHKRTRRWSFGKDAVNSRTLPDEMPGSSAAAKRSKLKAMATSREVPPKLKVEPDNGSIRTVPPSARAASNSLKIERFVRPFTLKAVQDLLGEFGQCVDFWMDQIKTHCFVTFASENEAVAAREGLYGRQWPPSVGNVLVAEFVDASEVKMRSEGTAAARPLPPPSPSFPGSPNRLAPSRLYREPQQAPLPPRRVQEPAVLTLEDLFYKTMAKPSIYYLPLTGEQVAQKLSATASKNRQAAMR